MLLAASRHWSSSRSPAFSKITRSRALVVSGVEYSGWAPSTYKRPPFCSTLLMARLSCWLGRSRSPLTSNPRASSSGFSPA